MTHRSQHHHLRSGKLAVRTWVGTSEPVLVVHGISSNNMLWQWLHDAAPDLTLIAPDLPGRGDSPPPRGDSSMARHADHLVELLDGLDLARVHLLGMSMGGFVSTALAARHPSRVASVTLVDGGLPIGQPGNGPDEETMRAQLSSAYADDTEWSDATACAAHYVETAAPLADSTDPRLVSFVAHGLARGAHGGHSRLDIDTAVTDGLDVFCTTSSQDHLAAVAAPTRLVFAEWSVGAGSPPMYAPDHVATVTEQTPSLLQSVLVPDVDHAAIVMTDEGATACAHMIRESMDS